jgi:GAF domain-containing protein
MGTLGRSTRNGKKAAARRVETRERAHPAVAKLAVALKEYKEAVEQQAATAEILRALSRSSGDPQSVFQAIVDNAHRLCGAVYSILYRYDAENMHVVAAQPVVAAVQRIAKSLYPAPPQRDHIVGRAILDGKPVHTLDVQNDPRFPGNRTGERARLAKLRPRRAVLAVPLLRNGAVIGAISVGRAEARAFTKKDIALLQTFADQAVIAVENVRLFNETKEALERQTATSEVLRVISGTPADPQPVFNAIAQSAARVFNAPHTGVALVDGGAIRLKATAGRIDPRGETLIPFDRNSSAGCALLDKAIVDVPDTEAADALPFARTSGRVVGFRAIASAPMLREGKAVGVITVMRAQPGALTDKQRQLLQTFADQAVIAIENARLFNETKEALERQTATADILKVISSSPTDVQPVFNAVAERAGQLCNAMHASVLIADGNVLRRAATVGHSLPFTELPVRRTLIHGRAFLERRTVHVEDIVPIMDAEYPDARENQRKSGFRTLLSVPMIREGKAIGTIGVWRREVKPFSREQIELLETFAAQAVIAIENVRLFNQTKEALEQQTAISEILGVISDSPTDVQPVLDAVAVRAARICDATDARIFLVDAESLRHVAGFGDVPMVVGLGDAMPLNRGSAMGRAVIDQSSIHIQDMQAESAQEYPQGRKVANQSGWRTVLAVPLMREDRSLGVIVLRRMQVRPFTEKQVALLKTFADQAAIAIENVRLFNETKEALERQTATAEILRVISSTPTDTQPVFDAIVQSAQRLMSGKSAVLLLRRESDFFVAAYSIPGLESLPPEVRTAPLDRDKNYPSRVMLDGEIVHVPDWEADDVIEFEKLVGKAYGIGSGLLVPLLRKRQGIGALAVTRQTKGAFSQKEMTLLQSFADQAVIAIENVRLFNETKESLEQQTATAEILKVISSSPTDIKPVLDAVAANAKRLCEANDALVQLREGDVLRFMAHDGTIPVQALGEVIPISRGLVTGRAMLEGRQLHIHDHHAEEVEFPEGTALARKFGFRTMLVTPLMRSGEAVGTIVIRRTEVKPFSDKHLALVKTFADQAVIAIENVRLFNELQTRNRALTEALEQQTATGEILKTISSATSEVQPVFETIIRNAVRLSDGASGMVFQYDGKLMDIGAHYNFTPEAEAEFRRAFPQRPRRDNPSGRAMLDRIMINVPDIHAADYSEEVKSRAHTLDYRSVLVVPMMRSDAPIGAISVVRRGSGAFTESYVELLKTFAAQAVIAVENVRLFNEINEALRLQTSTAEVLKTISRSTFDLDKVLQALLDNAARLSGGERGAMLRPDAEGNYVPTVTFNYPPDAPVIVRMREHPIRPGRDSINGRVLLEKRPIHVPDVLADPEYGRQDLIGVGRFRTVLSVPMLRDGEAIGLITLNKGEKVDPFTDKQMEVITTFADQAVIAIENVRLFKEIEEKSAQLEVANKHKSDFLANMSHELRTPLNAVIGFSEALMDRMFGELNEKQADYLKDIHESGKHLLSLINDILDLSKIEAGRMELDLSSFHLPSAISNAMTLIRERAQRHGVALGLDVDSRLGAFEADERKVKQILLNLLSNAVKFTPEGGRVEVSAKLDTDHVEIAVKDTGVGISPEDQTSLFEEFRQVGKDSSRKAEGTGLGLALTKRFVELHGGAIRVESAQGKGSTFTFSLPVRQ